MTEPTPPSTSIGTQTKSDLRGILAQLGPQTEIGRARRRLLPAWIKVFSWMFLIIGGGVPALAVVGLVEGFPVSFQLFGFSYSGSLQSVNALLMAIALGGCATTAYGLLWGRAWGQFAATATGWGGLAMCTASIFVVPGFHLPLEPVLLIPFIVSMNGRKVAWKEEAGD